MPHASVMSTPSLILLSELGWVKDAFLNCRQSWMHWCSGQSLRWLQWCWHLSITPLCYLLPLHMDPSVPKNSLFINLIQQKWWESLLKLGYKETMASTMHVLSFSLLLTVCDGIQLPYGEAHMARDWERPPANSQWGTEALRPTAHKDLISANNYMSELWSRSSLRWGFGWDCSPGQHFHYSLVRDQCLRFLTHRNCEIKMFDILSH